VDQRPQSLTAHARLIADVGRALPQEKAGGSATVIYSLISGLAALGVGAVASFAASSEVGRLVLWAVVTGTTAIVAGVAYESRWVRGLSRSVVRWIQAAQRL
jgi:hypothetical protein